MINNSSTSLEKAAGYSSVNAQMKAADLATTSQEKPSDVAAKELVTNPLPKEQQFIQADKNAKPVHSQAEEKPLHEKLEEAIPKVREALQRNQRSLDFKVAENENRVIITVIDKETDQIIRQIPPEDVLTMADRLNQDFATSLEGLIVDSKA